MGQKQEILKTQNNPATSPLLPATVQNEFFSEEEYECGKEMVAAYESTPGQFSGKILERRVELVENILERIAEGWSKLKVSKFFHVSRNSVQKLVERAEEDGRMVAFEKRMERQLEHVVTLGFDKIEELMEADQLKGKDLVFSTMCATDKLFVLKGKATSRVEHSYKDNSKDLAKDVLALVEEGKKLLQEKEIAIEVESRTAIQGVQADPVPGDT